MKSYLFLGILASVLWTQVRWSSAVSIQDILRELEEGLYYEKRLDSTSSPTSFGFTSTRSSSGTSTEATTMLLSSAPTSAGLVTSTRSSSDSNTRSTTVLPSSATTSTFLQSSYPPQSSGTTGYSTMAMSTTTSFTSQPLSQSTVTGSISDYSSYQPSSQPTSTEWQSSSSFQSTATPEYPTSSNQTIDENIGLPPNATIEPSPTNVSDASRMGYASVPGYIHFMASSAASLGLESILAMYYGEFPVNGTGIQDKWIGNVILPDDLHNELDRFSAFNTPPGPMKSNIVYFVRRALATFAFHKRMECKDAVFARILYQITRRKFKGHFLSHNIFSEFKEMFTEIFPSAPEQNLHDYLEFLDIGTNVLTQQYYFSLWLQDFNQIFWNMIPDIQKCFREPAMNRNPNATSGSPELLELLNHTLRTNANQLECSTIDQWEKRWLPRAGELFNEYLAKFSAIARGWLSRHSDFTASQKVKEEILTKTFDKFEEVGTFITHIAKKLQSGNESDVIEFFKVSLNETEFNFTKGLFEETDEGKNGFPETLNEAAEGHIKELAMLNRLKGMMRSHGLHGTKLMDVLHKLMEAKQARVENYTSKLANKSW